VYIGEPPLRGRGLGGFALFAALERALIEMDLRKLCCEVVDGNDVALAVYEHYGLVREGCLREQILKDGRPVDLHRLGILEREWRARREQHRGNLQRRGLL
jgi:RimJ/RimL family protein N-acetyltransferase